MAKKKRRPSRPRLELTTEETALLLNREEMPPPELLERIAQAQRSGLDPSWGYHATVRSVYNRLRQGPGWSAQRERTMQFFLAHQNKRAWWAAPSQKDIERFFGEGSSRGHAHRAYDLWRAGRLWIIGKKLDTQWVWSDPHHGRREEVKGDTLVDWRELNRLSYLELGGIKLGKIADEGSSGPYHHNRYLICYRIPDTFNASLIRPFLVDDHFVTKPQAAELVSLSTGMVKRSVRIGRYNGSRRERLIERLDAIEEFALSREFHDAVRMLLPSAERAWVTARAQSVAEARRLLELDTRRQVIEQDDESIVCDD